MSFEAYEQRGQQQESIESQLALLRENLSQRAYPGYPEFADRLVADPADLSRTVDGRLLLPDGLWNVDVHPDRPDTEVVPTLAAQAELLEQGYALDSRGRPLHPWLLKMLADPLIGVALGKGTYWDWAANRTVDTKVIKNDHALLVQRRDTGEWALPGGFMDTGESAPEAAKREVEEETGLVIPATASMIPVYQGPVVDIRATAHAWPETTAFLVRLGDDGPLPEVRGMDDAEAAAWVPLESLRNESIALFGSHRYLVARALGNLSL